MVTETYINEEGKEAEREIPMKVPSIKYLKFLLINKKAHLVDILGQFLGLYYSIYKEQIDKL